MFPEKLDITPTLQIPTAELSHRFSRSGGKGGQNVNKVETRVELLFDVANSPSLTPWQRQRLLENLSSHLDSEGMLRLVVSEARSQYANRQAAMERFERLLRHALRPRKSRRPTRPSRASKEKRLAGKKEHGQKKSARRWRPE